jgi:DNA-binding transcriptional MerR regulator
MTPDPTTRHTLSLGELMDATGETPRTIRYYISQGLLPSPAGFGPGSRYTAGHLDRLRLIRELQREHLPLATIRQRLERLSDEQVRDLLTTGQELPEPRGTAFDYIQSILSGTNRRAFTMPMPPTRPKQPTAAAQARGGAASPEPPAPPAQPAPPAAAASGPARSPAGASAPAFPPGAVHSTVGSGEELPGDAESVNSAPQANPSSPTSSPSNHDRSHWERVTLAPDVELHVRRPLSRIQNRRVERLLEIARQLLEEDQP